MIRKVENVNVNIPELIKDENRIKVRMFDEEDQLDDVMNADYKEMLSKKTVCSYCSIEAAVFLNWFLKYTHCGFFMFTFPTCNDHHWTGDDYYAFICMSNWATHSIKKWKKNNGLEGKNGAVFNCGYIPDGYANTVRRKLIDIAGKIVSHGGKIILKFTTACFDNLRLPELFERCNSAPAIR
jgi:hypothetical protein